MILKLAGFLMLIASMSANAVESKYPICDLGASMEKMMDREEVDLFKLREMKGKIQSVTTNELGLLKTTNLDKSGKVTDIKINRFGSDSLISYQYDDQGRVKQKTNGKFNYSFTYSNTGLVFIKTNWQADGVFRWAFELRDNFKNAEGKEVCASIHWSLEGGLMSAIRTVRESDGSYSSQSLWLENPEFSRFKQKVVDFNRAVSLAKEVETYLNNLPSSVEGCEQQPGSTPLYLCIITNKFIEGNLIKETRHINGPFNKKMFLSLVEWRDSASGLDVEFITSSDKPLENGYWPHHFYKYKFDQQGNWVERKGTVNVFRDGKVEEEPDRYDKEIGPTTSEFVYYK